MQLLESKDGGLWGFSHLPQLHKDDVLLRGFQEDGNLLSLGSLAETHTRYQSISGEAGGSRFSTQQNQNGSSLQRSDGVTTGSPSTVMSEPDLSLFLGRAEPPSLPISMRTMAERFHTQLHSSLPEVLKGSPSQFIPSRSKETAQLTIFYNGVVNVYNDFPADKAQAIMLLAGNGNFLETPSKMPLNTIPQSSSKAMSYGTPTSLSVSGLAIAPPMRFSAGPQIKQHQPQRRSYTSDLPHSRKASLVRFLQQRTERVQVKACRKEMEDGSKGKEEGCSDLRSPKRQCVTTPIREVSI